MMQTCTESGSTYGTDICTDDCAGWFKTDATIDFFVYRYYMQGQYHDGTVCTNPGCASPTAEYFPNTPICYRGCCPSGVTCDSIIPACAVATRRNTAGFVSEYTAGTVAGSGSTSTAGTDMANGLPLNPTACACGQLTCETTTVTISLTPELALVLTLAIT